MQEDIAGMRRYLLGLIYQQGEAIRSAPASENVQRHADVMETLARAVTHLSFGYRHAEPEGLTDDEEDGREGQGQQDAGSQGGEGQGDEGQRQEEGGE